MSAPIPVTVIGNITVGGSGKTPLLIHLVDYLTEKNVRVGVISRGYGGQGPFPAYVDFNTLPEIVGDEPALIVRHRRADGSWSQPAEKYRVIAAQT